MKGLDEFLKIFGDVTVFEIVELALAVIFIVTVLKKVSGYFKKKTEEEIKRTETEKVRDAQLKEALDAVHKYPEYRQQSLEIQRQFQIQFKQINERLGQMNKIDERLTQMEETTKRRERNKIRDHLLQSYKFYTDPKKNPTMSWTQMEADVFWDLFKEYEENGGDGQMHTDVQPAMLSLKVED